MRAAEKFHGQRVHADGDSPVRAQDQNGLLVASLRREGRLEQVHFAAIPYAPSFDFLLANIVHGLCVVHFIR